MESRQVIGFLIALSCTDVVRHTGQTEGTVTDDWLELIQDFTLISNKNIICWSW